METVWVPMSEAASILGVSFDTVKRRVRLGQIPKRREETAKGFRWLVEVPVQDGVHTRESARERTGESTGEATREDSREDSREGAPPQLGENALLRDLVETLRSERDYLREQLAVREREVSELHILLQREQERSRTLLMPPPQDHPDALAPEPARTDGGIPNGGASRRAWWKVWGRGMVSA